MFDHVVAFPEKLLKTIATICAIFTLKFTKNRLAAVLCPDPVGVLKHSPDPVAAIWGPTYKGRLGKRGEGRGRREVSGKGQREKEGRAASLFSDPGYGPEDSTKNTVRGVGLGCTEITFKAVVCLC